MSLKFGATRIRIEGWGEFRGRDLEDALDKVDKKANSGRRRSRRSLDHTLYRIIKRRAS